MAKRGSRAFGMWLAVCCCALGSAGSAAAQDDAFVRGYVSAVLELEEGTPAPLLGVQDGVVWLDASAIDGRRRAIEQRIEAVPGVTRVEWARRGDPRLTRLRERDPAAASEPPPV